MQWQYIPIQFTQGLTQKTDDKQITNQWLKLENVVMEKTGKFQKRRGFAKGTFSSGAQTIVSAGGDGKLLPLISDVSLQYQKFLDIGMLTRTQNNNTGVCSISSTNEIASLYLNEQFAGLFVSYFRTYDENAQILQLETQGGTLQIDATYNSQIAGVSDVSRNCFVIVADVNPIYNAYWGGASAVVVWDNGTLKTIESGFGAKKRLNLAAHGYGNYIFAAYSDIDAANTKVVRYNMTTQTVDASTTVVGNNVEVHISSNGTFVWVSAGAIIYKRNMDLTAVSSITAAETVKQISRTGHFLSEDADQTYSRTETGVLRSSWRKMSPAFVQPFTIGGVSYAVMTQKNPGYPSFWPGSHMIINMTTNTGDILSSMLYGFMCTSIGISQPKDGMIPLPTSTTYKIVNIVTGTNTDAISINGDLIYTTLGMRVAYGAISFLYGIPQQPPLPDATAGAGGSLAAGTYQITNVIESITASGNVIRSAPSPVKDLVVAANGTITVNSNIPFAEQRRSSHTTYSVYVKPPGGSLFFSLKRFLGLGDGVIATTLPTDSVGLYTSGDVLEDLPPPAVYGGISLAKNRIWCFNAENNDVRFSDPIIPGEMPMFSEAFSLPLPQSVGEGRMVVELDGKIIVFQQYAVSATYGDGPDQTGANNFPELQIIARDIGAINAKSVVTTNDGVFFLSTKGLWMIDRSLTTQYLGSAIEDGASGILCGAKLTDTEQVWFFSTNTAYIFDMYHKLWTTSPLGFSGVTGCKVIKNKLEIVASGYNYTMTGTSDDSGSIPVKLTSGWLSLAGLQGFERIRRIIFLADAIAANTMTVTLRYDFNNSDFETFTVASASVLTSGNTAEWIIRPRRQKCESMQIEISYTGTNAGVGFSGFAMEVGRKMGVNKMALGNKIGGN